MQSLFIKIDHSTTELSATTDCEWIIISNDTLEVHGRTPLKELNTELEEFTLSSIQNIVVLVPDDDVLWTSITIEGKNIGRIRQAIPFAVEPYLSENVEDLHIVNGGIERGNPIECLVVNRTVMQHWMDVLADCDLYPDIATTQGSIIPVANNGISILLEDVSALVKTHDQVSSVSLNALPETLQEIHDNYSPEGDETILHIMGSSMIDQERFLLSLGTDASSFTDIADGNFAYVSKQYLLSGCVNLLQKDFENKRSFKHTQDRWQPVLNFAATWFIIATLTIFAEGLYTKLRTDSLKNKIEFLYQDIHGRLPPAGVNPVQALKARLEGINIDDSSFIPLHVNFIKEAFSSGLITELTSLEYQQNYLIANCILSSFERVESLKDTFSSNGFDVEIMRAELVSGSWETSVKVSAV